jgi:hypothetical protein
LVTLFQHHVTSPVYRTGLAPLRELLGHSDISVTSKYLGASPQRAEAVAALAHLPEPAGTPNEQHGQLH